MFGAPVMPNKLYETKYVCRFAEKLVIIVFSTHFIGVGQHNLEYLTVEANPHLIDKYLV